MPRRGESGRVRAGSGRGGADAVSKSLNQRPDLKNALSPTPPAPRLPSPTTDAAWGDQKAEVGRERQGQGRVRERGADAVSKTIYQRPDLKDAVSPTPPTPRLPSPTTDAAWGDQKEPRRGTQGGVKGESRGIRGAESLNRRPDLNNALSPTPPAPRLPSLSLDAAWGDQKGPRRGSQGRVKGESREGRAREKNPKPKT